MTSAEFLHLQGNPAPKDPGRQIRGRNSQARGKSFEGELEAAHEAYEHLGVAAIDRLPVPTSPMPRTWLKEPKHGGIARILAVKQGFDFYGTVGQNTKPHNLLFGRAVAMEAKASQDFKTSLGITEKGPIRPHQLQALAERYSKFGTITALVWRNGEKLGVMLSPALVAAWQDYRIGTRKSLPWKAFTPYTMRRLDEGGMIHDWLSPVLAAEMTRIRAS